MMVHDKWEQGAIEMPSKPAQQICALILMLAVFIFGDSGLAGNSAQPSHGLQQAIQFGISHSHDISASQSETRFREKNAEFVKRGRVVPQLSLAVGYQQLAYDNLRIDNTGQAISNNGRNMMYSVTASYDLQKLFGPESILATQSTSFAKMREKIVQRDLIRGIKRSYYSIQEIKLEIIELNKLIALFSRIDEILKRQKKIGVFNELERRQFQVQQSILQNDLELRSSDLDAALLQLSTLINADLATTKALTEDTLTPPALVFVTQKVDPEILASRPDQTLMQNLSRDYNLSKLEYEKFNSIPLPVLFVKGSRDLPTMPSSDGPQSVVEIGVSFPIESLFTRAVQSEVLSARAKVNQSVFERNVFEYRNQIRLNALNLNRLKLQASSLEKTRNETSKLLDRTFLFYSQKRLDVLGTLDIFSKYLQAARNYFFNQQQIRIIDAELEYLVGGDS